MDFTYRRNIRRKASVTGESQMYHFYSVSGQAAGVDQVRYLAKRL
jgi:hypothetical protein